MSQVRIAVVGLSGMGFYHAYLVPKIPGYELVAVCDVIEKTCHNVAESSNCRPFTRYEDLIEAGCADAVLLATPNALHAEHARAALDAGLHVYCEKPLTVTAAEGRALGEQADAAGLTLQVGFQHRFQHDYATAHRLVASGELGPLFRANLYATDWFRPQAYFDQRPWRGTWRMAGGGVLMNQAVHQLDTFLWITGTPSRVSARAWRVRHRIEVEDDALAILEFPSGARGMLVASTSDAVGANRIELHAENGSLIAEAGELRRARIPDPVQQISDERQDVYSPVPFEWEEVPPEGLPVAFEECLIACHRDFLDAIAEGRPPVNTAVEASRVVEVANAVYLSAVRGEPVDLPLDPKDYADTFERLCAGDAQLPQRAGVPA